MAFTKVRFPKPNQPWPLIFLGRPEDQAKIQLAIRNKTVHAAVARSTMPAPNTSQATEKKKRKASFIEPSFASTSRTPSAVTVTTAPRVPNAIYPPTASQMIEVAEEADANEPEEDELPEELYTTLNTNIVGVQYYNGYMRRKLGYTSRIDASARSRRVWRTGEARTRTK